MDANPGDLVVCVDAGLTRCECGLSHNNSASRAAEGVSYVVARLAVASAISAGCSSVGCHCPALVMTDGTRGLAARFRKINHDKHEACEAEFVTLLMRAKRPVSA